MTPTTSLAERYRRLDHQLVARDPDDVVDAQILLTFEYPADATEQDVIIDTNEFTAVCPWTGLPDYGTLTIRYTPDRQCLELKSLKYYLLGYRDAGIVQELATNRILRDLVAACQPRRMTITLDYQPRGGLHTITTAEYTAST